MASHSETLCHTSSYKQQKCPVLTQYRVFLSINFEKGLYFYVKS
nr:MAG TPA: hypothetical protein [Herelleviridae sp.]